MSESASARQDRLNRQLRTVLIGVVVIGYVIAFLSSVVDSPTEIAVSVLLGVVYLSLALNEDRYYQRFPSPWGTAVYFIMQLALLVAIQLILGPNGTWLIGLPTAALAVDRLSPFWRWPVYLAILASMMVSVLAVGVSWESAILSTLTFSPALLFVVAYSELQLHQQRAREEAERLAMELEAANRQLAAYAVQAEELATMQERNRLAREIHDNLGHYLTVVNVQLEAARAVMAQDVERAQAAVEKAQTLTKDGLAAVRHSVAALRESPLDKRSLVAAIEELLVEMRKAGLVTDFRVVGEPCDLGPQVELALYRVAQEALTNVRKHARAARVDVTLDYEVGERVRLTVQDDGVGTAVIPDGGFGLVGMRERVELLGGELRVKTATGEGFMVETAVPIPQGETVR